MRPCAVRPKSCQELFSQAFLWRRPCLYSDPKSLGRISSVRIPTLILLRHTENHVYVWIYNYRLTFLESTILLCLTFSEIFAIFATLDCFFIQQVFYILGKNAKFYICKYLITVQVHYLVPFFHYWVFRYVIICIVLLCTLLYFRRKVINYPPTHVVLSCERNSK